jgi:hypothetical protein
MWVEQSTNNIVSWSLDLFMTRTVNRTKKDILRLLESCGCQRTFDSSDSRGTDHM